MTLSVNTILFWISFFIVCCVSENLNGFPPPRYFNMNALKIAVLSDEYSVFLTATGRVNIHYFDASSCGWLNLYNVCNVVASGRRIILWIWIIANYSPKDTLPLSTNLWLYINRIPLWLMSLQNVCYVIVFCRQAQTVTVNPVRRRSSSRLSLVSTPHLISSLSLEFNLLIIIVGQLL